MEHSESAFKSLHGYELYCQSWQAGSPRAKVIIAHGLAEHSGRYAKLARYLTDRGYGVFAYDYRGHGRSGGQRAYISRFADYVDDLNTYVKMVQVTRPEARVFVLGHSMGGTVAAAWAADFKPAAAGLVLSSPLLKVGDSVTPGTIRLAKVLARILPRLGVAPIESDAVSRDESVVKAYVTDPLVYRGKITARLGAELLTQINERLPRRLAEITLPVLIIHGTEDRLSNPDGSRLAYQRVSSGDKTLRLYPGLYHETMNEPEAAQVLEDIGLWLDGHA